MPPASSSLGIGASVGPAFALSLVWGCKSWSWMHTWAHFCAVFRVELSGHRLCICSVLENIRQVFHGPIPKNKIKQ